MFYIVASIVNSIYVLLNIDTELIGNTQIGVGAIEGWNGNNIGLMASTAGVLCVYMFTKAEKLVGKLFSIICCTLFCYLFIYTGSRKSIILFLTCVIMMLFMSNPYKVIRNVFLTGIILIVSYNLIMKVDSIYEILGVRLEGLIAGFGGEGDVDSSTLLRKEYISNGIKWLKESPFIGYGVDGYRTLNGAETRHYTYSHNNFIEIAINWGIIGFLYYYSAYLLVIKKCLKLLKRNMLAVTIFSLFIVNLILHYGMVAYYEIWQNLLLCIAFAVINTEDKAIIGGSNDKKSN